MRKTTTAITTAPVIANTLPCFREHTEEFRQQALVHISQADNNGATRHSIAVMHELNRLRDMAGALQSFAADLLHHLDAIAWTQTFHYGNCQA